MLRKKSLSFADKQAKPMTAATMITGTVFSLDLLVVKTCLEDLVRIDSKVAGGFLRLLVAEICLVDLLLGVFGVSPNVVALIIEIAIVFNFASYVLVYLVEYAALISFSLISIVSTSYPLKGLFPIVKVCFLLAKHCRSPFFWFFFQIVRDETL